MAIAQKEEAESPLGRFEGIRHTVLQKNHPFPKAASVGT
jgi:hypothetical protein